MKTIIIFTVLLYTAAIHMNAQDRTEDLVKKVAGLILSENSDGIKVISTGVVINSLADLPKDEKLALASRYKTWEYWNGVLNTAMLELYRQFKEEKYKNYALDNYAYIFDNYDVFKKLDAENRLDDLYQFWKMGLLDHCGSMASGLVEVYKMDKRKDYLSYLNIVGDYMLNKEVRLTDGTLARVVPHDKTLWLDDLYMSVPFLARMGNLTGDRKYFDFAAKQVKQFTKYLYDERTGLYFHCYYDDIKEQGVAHWGRANGWSIMAQANLLQFLPKDHPDRPELLRIFKQQILGFSRYQSEKGLWHQILDREDSYLETSCTAMFTYAVAKGVNEGWIEPRYKTIALEGWRGIASMINAKGQAENICIGTGTSTAMIHYYKRPVQTNDIHGLGAVLMAGLEVLRLPVDPEEE
jgi:unsaturated rhamnogalacturonyl hydrolase